jgi:hypothetical protein
MKLILIAALLFLFSPVAGAAATSGNFGGIADALPEQLGRAKATTELKQFNHEELPQLTGERPSFYDYGVKSAATREYGSLRADVFETNDQFGAFGLFTFNLGRETGEKVTLEEIGRCGAKLDDQVIFWKGNYVVRILGTAEKPLKPSSAALALARAIDAAINPPLDSVAKKPALLESLPTGSRIAGSERYFTGPEALATYVDHAREMYPFFGDAHAVLASYDQGSDKPPLTLLIVEYHTPQFATDAMGQLSEFLPTLSRIGNARRRWSTPSSTPTPSSG